MATIFKHTCSALLGLCVLSGCATQAKYAQSHLENIKRTNEAIAILQQDQPRPQYAVEDRRLVVSTRSIPLGRDAALPEGIRKITLRMGERMTLSAVAELLAREIKIPVVLSPELMDSQNGKNQGSSRGNSNQGNSEVGTNQVDYSGSLSGLLTQLASQAQAQWKYENGRIVFFKIQTVTYVLKAFSSDYKISTTLSGSSNGGGGLSGSIDSESNYWQGFETGLKSLVSDKSRSSVDKNAGILVLTDTFEVHEQVEKFIGLMNASVLRQIALDVEIITVDLNHESAQGIDWTWVNSTLLASGLVDKFKVATPASPSVTVGGNTPFTASFNGASGRSVMVQLLQAFGKVSTAYSGILVTTNRTAVPVSVSNSITYLAQTTPGLPNTAGGGVGAPGLTPGQITTGTNVTLMPIILDSNQVMLQSVIKLSALKALTRFDSGQGSSQQSIQLPNVDSFTVVQRVVVPSGQTMVMVGYDRTQSTSNTLGLVEGLETNKATTGNKQSVVVLVTPRLMDI
jgi:type IVB pilus formation R64 PilN family outer membrane protein